jgi:hypothetical protein
MILDIYAGKDNIVYIDLNPAYAIEMPNSAIRTALEISPIPAEFTIRRTVEYNVAIFAEVKFAVPPYSIIINGKEHLVKQQPPLRPVELQLCLVFKNEWQRVPTVLNYYRRVHGVQRFILYDNQSDSPPPHEILAISDVVYEFWNLSYKHTIADKKNLSESYDGPIEIIIAQNSAYSHCLKRYRQATWTALLDLDEFVVRRRDNLALRKLVAEISPQVHSILVKGYWAGCNKVPQAEIYNSLKKFTRRSQKFCMNKLILRTAEHVFTNCIHNPYPTNGAIVTLAFDRGYYFFHLYTASAKNRKCDCSIYCQVQDRSLLDSLAF